MSADPIYGAVILGAAALAVLWAIKKSVKILGILAVAVFAAALWQGALGR